MAIQHNNEILPLNPAAALDALLKNGEWCGRCKCSIDLCVCNPYDGESGKLQTREEIAQEMGRNQQQERRTDWHNEEFGDAQFGNGTPHVPGPELLRQRAG